MADFTDADRLKKRGRIILPDNPGNLSEDELSLLENSIKSSVKDGYLSCLSAWQLAERPGFSRLDAGVMMDRLGVRVKDCQLGCFKLTKSVRGTADSIIHDPGIIAGKIGRAHV